VNRPTRAIRLLASWFFGLATLVAVLLSLGSIAKAEAPSAPPRDVPVVPEGASAASLSLPVVPADFEHRDLGWLQVASTPNASERLKPLLAEANAFREKLAASLGQTVLEHVELRIARTPEEMANVAPAALPPPAYAVGVAYPGLDLVLLTLTEPRTSEGTDLGEVFRHELAHIALNDAVRGQHVPTWFNEGLAIHLSGERFFDRQKTLWDARLSGTILPLDQIDRSFPSESYDVSIAYAESADFVRFLLRKADSARFIALVQRVRDGQAFNGALGNAYGTDVRKLEYQWRGEVDHKFNYLPVIMGGSLLWAALFGVMVAAYVKRRRRAKKTLARWAREEAALDAAIEQARRAERATDANAPLPDAALLHASSRFARTGTNAPDTRAHPHESMAKVEHDGNWHTLH
jgi:hypothetical protein